MTINTTQNKFYEDVILKKGGQAKSIVLPNINLKADLGTPQKKFRNIYAENLIGATNNPSEVTRGSWTPTFVFSSKRRSIVPAPPADEIPTHHIIEARYQKIGKEVTLFANFSLTARVKAGTSKTVFVYISGLPFVNTESGGSGSLLSRIYFSNSSTDSFTSPPLTNIYNYDFSNLLNSLIIANKKSVFVSANDQLIGRNAEKSFAEDYTNPTNPPTRYYYLSGTYVTN